jgi:hypothetical protein
MSGLYEYYNGFYKELSKIDEKGNSLKKIESFLPELEGNEEFLNIGCRHVAVSSDLIKQGYKVSAIEINK